MIGPLIRARQPWRAKLQGAFHLTAYLAHPLMLLSVLLLLPTAIFSSATPAWLSCCVQLATPWLMGSALGPPLLYTVAQMADGRGWPRRLAALPLLRRRWLARSTMGPAESSILHRSSFVD